jgi:hypothetical protein
MAEYNHFCKICGKGYNACDTCINQKNYAAWRAIACTQDHFQAYMVLYEYGNGTLKKADAKEMLSKVNVDGWEGYAAHNRDVIAEILAEDEKPVEVISEPLKVVEPQVAQVVSQPPQYSNKQQQKPQYSGYNKFKK